MRIGLIDVDGHNFPNLPLMKLSAWHKEKGDSVEWYTPVIHGFPKSPFDIVYASKIFSFSPDYLYNINAKQIIKGGSGYRIKLVDGKEEYDSESDILLPDEIEKVYPDYSLYYEKIPEVRDTAYGFLTRGCPNNCGFCHVSQKEGMRSRKVADLSSFWKGQKNVVLLDPNLTACPDWRDLFLQLIESRAWIDFSQGLDIRLMTEEKTKMLMEMNVKQVRFAWDRYSDKEYIVPKFSRFREMTGWGYYKMTVYVLCGYDTTIEQDLDRIYTLRDLGYSPYVMIYNKSLLPKVHVLRDLQRWVCGRQIFRSCKRFEEYRP